MSFGKKLRAKREEYGLNRVEMSKASGISYSRLNSMESDFKPDTIEMKTAIKISETLGWDIKDIAKTIRPYIKWEK